jgi:NADPH-dependent curcumin reductase CurA
MNEFVHLWRFDDFADMESRQAALNSDEWISTGDVNVQNTVEVGIERAPAAFSQGCFLAEI